LSELFVKIGEGRRQNSLTELDDRLREGVLSFVDQDEGGPHCTAPCCATPVSTTCCSPSIGISPQKLGPPDVEPAAGGRIARGIPASFEAGSRS
jgi:hypothetical protein